jgi:hypothetical protein
MVSDFKDACENQTYATGIATQIDVGWHYCQSSRVSFHHEF